MRAGLGVCRAIGVAEPRVKAGETEVRCARSYRQRTRHGRRTGGAASGCGDLVAENAQRGARIHADLDPKANLRQRRYRTQYVTFFGLMRLSVTYYDLRAAAIPRPCPLTN